MGRLEGRREAHGIVNGGCFGLGTYGEHRGDAARLLQN